MPAACAHIGLLHAKWGGEDPLLWTWGRGGGVVTPLPLRLRPWEHKPQFHLKVHAHMIKATQPFKRRNVDLKRPLKLNNQKTFFLNIADEYSHFSFVFRCKDVSACSIIGCLVQLFSVYGRPAYIHSYWGVTLWVVVPIIHRCVNPWVMPI